MRLLIDENLSYRLVTHLSELFEEVTHVERLGLSATADDRIWRLAIERGFAILTKDSDFADRALLEGPPPKVIRLRIGNGHWKRTLEVVEANLDLIHRFLMDDEPACLILTVIPSG